MDKVYVDTLGLTVILTTDQDLTQATKVEMRVKKPDGEKVTWACHKGINGELIYRTAEGELALPGRYKIQAYAEWGIPATSKHKGRTVTLQIDKEFS